MAKLSVIHRDLKRRKLTQNAFAKRKTLKKTIVDLNLPFAERLEAGKKLLDLPRDTSPVRNRNRCQLCGRPRGYNRKTGLCRMHMRIAMLDGMIPGMVKSSW